MTVREALRAATAGVHARLDARAASLDLSRRDDYARFLTAQAGPVLALEAARERAGVLDEVDWPERSRTAALRQDLGALGLAEPTPPQVRIDSRPQIFGTLYVLEGSRLGASVLVAKAADLPAAFLHHGEGRRLWPTFLTLLEEKISEDDLPECIQGAVGAM
jgi:heme oxygenase